MERSEQAFLAGFEAGFEKRAKVNILARLFGKKKVELPPTKIEKIKALVGSLGGPARGFAKGFARGAVPGLAIGALIGLGSRTKKKIEEKQE